MCCGVGGGGQVWCCTAVEGECGSGCGCGWVGRDAVWVSARDEEKPLWWLWRKVDVRVVLCSLQSRGVVWLRPAGSEGLCPGRHVWRSLLEPAPLRTPCVDCRHLGSDVVQTLLSPSCLTSHTSYTWYVGLGKGLLPSHMGTRPLAGVRHAPYLRPVSGHLPACMSWDLITGVQMCVT